MFYICCFNFVLLFSLIKSLFVLHISSLISPFDHSKAETVRVARIIAALENESKKERTCQNILAQYCYGKM